MGDTGPGPIDARPSGRSGFRIFIYVLLGLGALAIGTCAVGAYFLMQDEDLRGLVQSAVESQTGPGHDALVAEGCQVALALDLGRAAALAEKWAGQGAELEELANKLVQCETEPGNPLGLDCERVARVFASAEPPSDRFLVIVSSAGADEAICSVLADPQGNVLESLEEALDEEPAS